MPSDRADPFKVYWPEPHPAGQAWREQQEKLLSLMERMSPADPAYGDTWKALSWIGGLLDALEVGEFRRWQERQGFFARAPRIVRPCSPSSRRPRNARSIVGVRSLDSRVDG